jgi:hypothetical protein
MLVSLRPRASAPRAAARISPADGRSRPAMICSSVDFPHPDGPRKIRNSPAATSRLSDSIAVTRSPVRAMAQCFAIPRSSRISGLPWNDARLMRRSF